MPGKIDYDIENLTAHISALVALLSQKGYDGYFKTNMGYPDRLANSIHRYFEAFREGKEGSDCSTVSLYTYSQYNGEDQERVTCYFRAKYHQEKGFELNRLLIERTSATGVVLGHKDLEIDQPMGIPDRQAANEMVTCPLTNKKIRR